MKVHDPDERLAELAAQIGLDLGSVAVPGGAYAPAVRHGDLVYLSGQLGVLQGAVGSLKRLEQVLRLNVFVQAGSGFHRLNEVADVASTVIADVLQSVEKHARTAVGVSTLPRNASVEVDMTVALEPESKGS